MGLNAPTERKATFGVASLLDTLLVKNTDDDE